MDKTVKKEPRFGFFFIFAGLAAFELFDGIVNGFDRFAGVRLTIYVVVAVWGLILAKRTSRRSQE